METEIDSIQLRKCIEEHGEYLIRLAYMYVKNWSTAEDIVQEVFVSYYQKSNQFENRSSLKTYLAKITVNKCHDHLRSWKNKVHLYSNMVQAKTIQNKHSSTEQIVIEKHDSNVLLKEIFNMSLKYRDVILLYYYQEFTIAEISNILGCSENTVKTRLSRAKSILKNKLTESQMEVYLNEQH
jgi:RNA polymerase sigma factor (sigma-70 family)